MLRLSCEQNTANFTASSVVAVCRPVEGCCYANAAVVMTIAVRKMTLLPCQCCCCFSNTFNYAALGTAVYNVVFSLQAVTAVVIVLALILLLMLTTADVAVVVIAFTLYAKHLKQQ